MSFSSLVSPVALGPVFAVLLGIGLSQTLAADAPVPAATGASRSSPYVRNAREQAELSHASDRPVAGNPAQQPATPKHARRSRRGTGQ